jgi:hypothetical protein
LRDFKIEKLFSLKSGAKNLVMKLEDDP